MFKTFVFIHTDAFCVTFESVWEYAIQTFLLTLEKPCVAIKVNFITEEEKFRRNWKMNKRLLATITAIVAFLAVAFVTTSHLTVAPKRLTRSPLSGSYNW